MLQESHRYVIGDFMGKNLARLGRKHFAFNSIKPFYAITSVLAQLSAEFIISCTLLWQLATSLPCSEYVTWAN